MDLAIRTTGVDFQGLFHQISAPWIKKLKTKRPYFSEKKLSDSPELLVNFSLQTQIFTDNSMDSNYRL